MKKGKSILTRCLALALALVLIASSANLGTVLKVFAAEQKTVKVSELVVNNYELTDAEKALITSGQLVDGDVTYTAFNADEINVVVDTDAKTITAPNYHGWVPSKVEVITSENADVVITDKGNGVYEHNYTGNAYSVKVTYKLDLTADEAIQNAQLKAAAALKNNLDNQTAAGNVNLAGVVAAKDALKKIANGEIKVTVPGFGTFQVVFKHETTKQAALDMVADIEENDGKLTLQVHQENYKAAASKTQYLVENGEAYKAAVDQTYAWLVALSNTDDVIGNTSQDETLNTIDSSTYEAIVLLRDMLGTAIDGLKGPAEAEWGSVDAYLTGTRYAVVDELVGALGEISVNTVKNPLSFGEAEKQVNLSMKNVSVKVVLKQTEDKVESTTLVEAASASGMETLAENANNAAIKAAVDGIVADAIASWDVTNCVVDYPVLPDSLTEDISVVVTYSPKTLNVIYGYTTEEPTSVPYGYQLKLDDHADTAKSYDYEVTFVGSAAEKLMQGAVIVVTDDVQISRSEGRAYTKLDLYTQVGKYFGNKTTQDILSSGALLDNEDIYVRVPNNNDAEEILSLEAGVLTADVPAFDNQWAPYSYGKSDSMNPYTGPAAWTENQAKVIYKRTLADLGYTAADTQAVLDLAATLKDEAEGQLSALASLYGGLADMEILNDTVIGALGGVVNTTNFFPSNAEKTAAMKALFKEAIDGIFENCMTDGKLTLYTLLLPAADYDDGLRLKYYYDNYEAIHAELEKMVQYLNLLLEGDDHFSSDEKMEAIMVLCSKNVAGMELSPYADQIVTLKEDLNKGLNDLKTPNAKIDLSSASLANLTDVLASDASVENKTADVPYILSSELSVVNNDFVQVQVTLEIKGETYGVETTPIMKGTELSSAAVAQLLADMDAKVTGILGEAKPYYDVTYDLDVSTLAGVLSENKKATYTYTPKTYTVKVEGEADQTVTAENLYVNLPAYPTEAKVYKYYLNGNPVATGSYKFNLSDLGTLFPAGVCTFTRETINVNENTLGTILDKLNDNTSGNVYTTEKDAEGNTTTLNAKILGSQNGVMGFAMDLVMECDYSYIGLNGQPLMYLNENNELEVSIQTLIDAILADENFGSQTLIDLGNNNGGKLLTASMQLGFAQDNLHFEDLEFVLELNGVPGAMGTVSNGLNTIKNNMNFQSKNGYMNVNLTLPEKVYEIYLTAMWGIGELDKSDINAINNEIAFMFFYDYLMLLAESDVTSQTFENTLALLDQAANEVLNKDIPDYDLSAYDEYIALVKRALKSENVVIEANTDETTISVEGQGAYIETVMSALGLDISEYTDLVKIKEFKDGNTLKATMKANLSNFDTNFEAIVFDVDAAIEGARDIKNLESSNEAAYLAVDMVRGKSLANSIDYTSDLSARAAELNRQAVVFLLDDVEDTLVFNTTTVIDLNGKSVKEIVAVGDVYIMDSTLDTLSAGKVETISGNAHIIAGNYGCDVSAYLPDGYKQVANGNYNNVQNALYIIESTNSGDLNFTVNTDVMYDESVNGYLPNVAGLAVDIASDLALNYYLSALLQIDGNTIANVDFDDVIGILKGVDTKTDAVNEILSVFDAEGTSNFINAVSADLLDFAGIKAAIENGEKVASYQLTVAPYGIELYHNTEYDCLTFNVGSVESKARSFEVSLTLAGENKEYVAQLAGELDSIVVADDTYAIINLEQPTFSDRTLWLAGSTKHSLSLDLSKEAKFQTILAVILAYGNPEKAEDLVNAIGNENELKALFNEISVAEIFTALKELKGDVSFEEMAESLNVPVDYTEAAEYEKYFHLLMTAFGFVLDRLDITGYTDKTMGMIEVDDSGRYELTYNRNVHADITRRGITVDASGVIEEITLSVKIFNKVEEESDCLWGDVNHDGFVDSRDACLILQYDVREGNLELMDYQGEFCLEKADVSNDGLIDSRDACLILQRDVNPETVFPAEG